ncbi:MAG: hypothetical protein K9M98_01710 [Cephaloticoccus sp.]|nr:hypothetical protein [Cephaloticoccus sp.]MCF7759194.1 hypothetical protein [Cephaloticoccus sp.]
MEPSYFLLAAIFVTIVLVQVNQRAGSPVIAIFVRWMRWLVFGFGLAQMSVDFNLINRPFWALVITFMLVWFLGETLYNWLGIQALSVSSLPLFPRYAVNQSGEEWPTHPRLLKVREWLRAQGFKQVQALKAEIGGGIYLRGSVYQDAEGRVRVQVTFLPQANGMVSVCFALVSLTADGSRFVTDNFYIPFGGFYPENWLVERLPWRRALPRLLARHRQRTAGETLVAFDADPLTDLNSQQHELDQLNTQLGFLNPHSEREEFGKITQAGRYRVWKEIWMLNYLGLSVRYQ